MNTEAIENQTNSALGDKPPNPFEYTRPIVDEGKTIARPDVIRAITNVLHRESVVSVMGSWQTGKTGVLFSLREQFERTVYVNFDTDSYGAVNDVLSTLFDNIDRQIPDTFGDIVVNGNDSRALVRLFHNLAKQASITFLIDALPMPREIAYQFLSAIRVYLMESIADANETIHKFVIASAVDLVTFTHEINPDVSPFNIAIPVYLEDFPDAEIEAFIHRMAPNKFSEQEIEKIFDYTGGHPFLVQFICHHLYEPSETKRAEILKNVDTVVKALALEDTSNIKSMLDDVDISEKSSKTKTTLESILRGKRILFSHAAKPIQTLYLQGAIREDKEGYCAIRNPLYEVVLRRAFDTSDAQKLKKAPERKTVRRELPGRIIEIYG